MLAGCAATYQMQTLNETKTFLERGKGVYISIPKDGSYGNDVYSNSGRMTADALKAGFMKYSNKVYLTNECHGDTCFEKIPIEEYSYYVWPEILHWEERATEWLGLPDRIEVKILIFDTGTKQELSSVVLRGKSKWATFGGDHPQDLLPEPINDYLILMYRN